MPALASQREATLSLTCATGIPAGLSGPSFFNAGILSVFSSCCGPVTKMTGSPDAMHRFEREMKAAARLSHPNIVTAYDARRDDGVMYLVIEYVDGIDLSRLVR